MSLKKLLKIAKVVFTRKIKNALQFWAKNVARYRL